VLCEVVAQEAKNFESSSTNFEAVAPESFVDAMGHKYVKSRKARFSNLTPAEVRARLQDDPSATEEAIGSDGERTIYFPKRAPYEDLRTLSVNEIAQRFRSVVLRDGFEYIEEQPPIALATTIKASFGKRAPSTPPNRGIASESVPSDEVDSISPESIIGSDNRTYEGAFTGYPNRAQLSTWPVNCSATLIGPRTAVIAAHCVYEDGHWYTIEYFIPAANSLPPTEPFGRFNAFNIRVPQQWLTDEDWNYDFAAVEFWGLPQFFPGNVVGWLGTADSSSGLMRMVSYPGDKNPRPQLWGKVGTVTSTTSGRRKHNLDTVGGDSGAGLYTVDTLHVVGIHSTENWSRPWWCPWCDKTYWNEATRWRSAVHEFFAARRIWP
jgi:V8-like Glu-specific endopeptidase